MKFSAITSVFCLASAALAAPAAPASVEERALIQLEPFNNFRFVNLDLAYLQAINGFDLQSFVNLQLKNNLDLSSFQSLFLEDAFTVNKILQLQQVAILSQLSAIGAFSNIDLSRVKLGGFNFAQIATIANFPLNTLINTVLQPQLRVVVDQTPPLTIII
ncbi:uncharacterized protein B0I36DRAFT_360811 [Microdochium trichocladiopsis]|uniref:Uncharacterized protein n=1 Tax=Microdochium trichocladiopsis TaxID=1682393 RepID=A0A9P9BTF7_9PEZI|nr:uncharacterized protein B0I36DRAFT_360811 [Microdochium trichocladiopsis]KAH7035447.1 hypothetical protein B0I36DRAFT_360811 [Microdochium trichocladiopsis]